MAEVITSIFEGAASFHVVSRELENTVLILIVARGILAVFIGFRPWDPDCLPGVLLFPVSLLLACAVEEVCLCVISAPRSI